MKPIIKKTAIALCITISVILVLFLVCNHVVTSNAESRLSDSVAEILDSKDGLDLDTSHQGEPIGEEAEQFPAMRIDTTYNLLVYYPDFSRIDLICDTMPSITDQQVIFCAEAAFTADYLDHFTHDNICGPHVSQGVSYAGAGQGASGTFTYAAGQWHFSITNKSQLLAQAAKQGGMGFSQYMVIYNGKVKSKPFKDEARNEYRCLCEKDGKLCIIDSRTNQPYSLFRDALLAYGVRYAIYLDMGMGWNYSWWRDEKGKAHEIHNHRIPYTTNWITFYK